MFPKKGKNRRRNKKVSATELGHARRLYTFVDFLFGTSLAAAQNAKSLAIKHAATSLEKKFST